MAIISQFYKTGLKIELITNFEFTAWQEFEMTEDQLFTSENTHDFKLRTFYRCLVALYFFETA